jgi:hypothetical protein
MAAPLSAAGLQATVASAAGARDSTLGPLVAELLKFPQDYLYDREFGWGTVFGRIRAVARALQRGAARFRGVSGYPRALTAGLGASRSKPRCNF